MGTVSCLRCGSSVEAMTEPPFGGKLGEEVRRGTCPSCWSAWELLSRRIINEYRLNLANSQHFDALVEQMRLFLKLPQPP